MYLFTDKNLALEWVETKKQAEINAIDNQIYQLNSLKEKIYQKFANILFEEPFILKQP